MIALAALAFLGLPHILGPPYIKEPAVQEEALTTIPAKLEADPIVAIASDMTVDAGALDDPNETELVLGISVRKDRDCTVYEEEIVDANGERSIAHRCEPNSPEPEHPYTKYSIEELRELAYRDSAAAEILGIKLLQAGDEQEGLGFIYRAVALSSGASMLALKRAHNTFYSAIITSKPESEPTPAISEMKQAYIFSRIQEKLNGDRHSTYLKKELETFGYTEFGELERKVEAALAMMADVEIEVVGSRSIKEKNET